jgi:hypothetical protein
MNVAAIARNAGRSFVRSGPTRIKTRRKPAACRPIYFFVVSDLEAIVKRRSYDSVQVLLHCLSAVSVIVSLVCGKPILKNLPHDVNEECAESLGNH